MPDPHRTYTPEEVEAAKRDATHQDWVKAVRESREGQRVRRGVRNKRTGY